jgi:hypothetical protein
MLMKILSLRQPYAYLDTRGTKNRSRPTRYRGPPFLIHASPNVDREECEDYGFDPDRLERDGVLGMAEIVDCVADHAGKWFSGPYGYMQPLPFVKSHGALGLLEAPTAPLRKLGLKG